MKTIINLHFMGGPIFMFSLSLMFITILGLAIYTYIITSDNHQLRRGKIKNLMLSIIYLGGFAAVWGILGQGIGIYQALYAIQMAGDISPALIFGGIKISMIAPLYGIIILLVTSIIWLLLRFKINLMSS